MNPTTTAAPSNPNNNLTPFVNAATIRELINTLQFTQIMSVGAGEDEAQILAYYEQQMGGGEV